MSEAVLPEAEGVEAVAGNIISSSKAFLDGPEGTKRRQVRATALKKLREANSIISSATDRSSHFCKAGCAFCCRQAFRVTPVECAAIAYHLLQNRNDLTAFLAARRDNELRHGHRASLLTTYEVDGPMTMEESLDYFGRKIPCDFLREERCLIYQVRPLVCSSFVAFAPPRICALEPKGHVPPEAKKPYHEANYWFQTQSRMHYPRHELLTINWLELVYTFLTTDGA